MTKTGIIHVHSIFSHDGQHTLEEIALFVKKLGYSFIGMTEHSDTFNEDKMFNFVKECMRLSDSKFLMIPGIEFTCENNLHIIGLGIEHFTDIKDPISVAQFIRAQGGLAMVSHPVRYDYKIPSALETEINGVEIWNTAYDGRFVPNDRSIVLWQTLRKHNKSLIAFGGQDLHHITGHFHVKITISCNELKQETILWALKEGNFLISNPYFRLHSARPTGWIKRMSIICARRTYMQMKSIRDYLNR